MTIRCGTIGYACYQGLGVLIKSFYDAGVVTDVLVVEHSRPVERTWYPNAPTTPIRPFDCKLARDFCASMDVMFFFETPFDWALIRYCKELGVRTILMPMYECMPKVLPSEPDLIIAPSLLDQQYYRDSVFIPVPVEGIAWRQREKATNFIHNAGHGGLRGRNGTLELLQAVHSVKSPFRLTVRAQDEKLFQAARETGITLDDRVELEGGTIPFERLYSDGDVFIFPEKFNGLSLPLQEARAAGLLIMASNRFPMNTWLPQEPLIPVERYFKSRIGGGCLEFDEAVIEPAAIAKTIDAWFGQDVGAYSQSGRQWAQDNSWAALKPQYMRAIGE